MNKIIENDREIFTGATESEWLDLRTHDITSTDAAALFGISPYLTHYELWHRKKAGSVVAFEPTERMQWGTRLQDAIANGIAEDNGWKVRRMDEYVRLVKLPIGSSFDFSACVHPTDGLGSAVVGTEKDDALLEIKNVDSLAFKEGWLINGDNVEAPPHIELQVQHQLAVAGRQVAYIGALIGGNRVVLIRRERDEAVIQSLLGRVQAFWDTIDKDQEPTPDFQKDADFIRTLYKYAEPGKVLDATGNELLATLVLNYKKAGEAEKMLKAEKDGYKAQMLTLIGDAAKVIAPAYTISAGMIGPKHVEYDTDGYRDFRIYQKKEK